MSFGMKTVDQSLIDDHCNDLTLEDLHTAAATSNLGKAPGRDGITLEFYLFFWQFLGPVILQWFFHTLSMGQLVGSAAQGVISIVSKSGDHRSLENWRPISLLTVDLKIVLKAITNKITPLILSVLSHHQTAVPASSIFSSLYVIRDIITLHNIDKNPLWVLSIDQKKAFDNVSHDFIFHLLHTIGLPQFLVRSVKALYTGFTCVVKNASVLSEPFPYHKGIRQGDPSSTILYALASQPLINALHLALVEEGFRLPTNESILLTAYADDLTLFLHTENSVKIILEIFEIIAQYSGAKINVTKSKIFGLNIPLDRRNSHFLTDAGISTMFDFIKILGILFTPDLKIHPIQWNQKLTSTRATLITNFQKMINMTYFQRAAWATKKLWPRWAFILKTLQPSKNQIAELTNLMAEVVWLNGRHWIPSGQLADPIHQGGLAAISPVHKIAVLRVMMLAKYCVMDRQTHPFLLAQLIMNKYAALDLGFQLLHSSPELVELHTLPPIYAAAFQAWNSLPTCFRPKCIEEIKDMPIISSKFLIQADPPLMITSSVARYMNIRTIRDLYNYTPSRTRLSGKLVNALREIIEEWVNPPWPNDQVSDVHSPVSSPNSSLDFLLINGDSMLPVQKWSNSIIACAVRRAIHLQETTEVQPATWKILAKVSAPALYINQYWRFLHKSIVTPSYMCKLGLVPLPSCFLCNFQDCTLDHQFRLCPVLALTMDSINDFIQRLDLLPLVDQYNLYPFPNNDHRLANFIILAFFYTVGLVSRTCANSRDIKISPTKMRNIFFSIITKHLVYHAHLNPPNDPLLRNKWSLFTHKKILAYFQGSHLYILNLQSYKRYIN